MRATRAQGFERFKSGEAAWLEEAVSKRAVMLTPPETVYSNVAANFYQMPSEAKPMVQDRLSIIGGPDFDGFAYAVSRSVAAMLHGPVYDRLPQVKVPVLVLFGERDQLIPA